MLHVFLELGYKTTAPPTRIQPDDIALTGIQWPCEICARKNTAADSVTCCACHRRYHVQCVTGTQPVLGQQCKCRQCSAKRWTSDTLPPELWLYKATWQDAYEPIPTVLAAGTDHAKEQLLSMPAVQGMQLTASESSPPPPKQTCPAPRPRRLPIPCTTSR